MPLQDIYQAVIQFKMADIAGLVHKELDVGTEIETILNQGLIAPMDEVGKRFSDGELFVPEMLMAAKVMKAGLEILKPLMIQTDSDSKGTVIIGTVHGDLHDIGKNLVIMMLEGGGFKVVDLGIDAEAKSFLRAVNDHGPGVVALSALLTTTMPAMEETVAELKTENPDIKIMVGGAPVNQSFADKIGADGYGEDAPGAVGLARKFFGLA